MKEEDKIKHLVINSPYEEPKMHWRYNPQTNKFALIEKRRLAGYSVTMGDSRQNLPIGQFVELPLANAVRARVKDWRERGRPGISGITQRLLEYWNDPEEFEARRFFFCQMEAIETLIWLTEASDTEKTGVEIPSDGGSFSRYCTKMATGTGKTIVMTMTIAWNILNKVANPSDPRFSKYVLVIAPNLTIKNRLSVLKPDAPDNYYSFQRVVPPSLISELRNGMVVVQNRHALEWDNEEAIAKRRGVDKRGPKSDEAYVKDVLGKMAKSSKILVINDEAHHAWRVSKQAGRGIIARKEVEMATKWVAGLDRIHGSKERILQCYDFSATPFPPVNVANTGSYLFGWIVSDFGLNDAIESGLVKTPRVVVRDDAKPNARSIVSRLYHIYEDPEVKDDLNRQVPPETALPDLLNTAYYLLGYDWREVARLWETTKSEVPPVMITIANTTETAARIKFAFDREKIRIPELCDPMATLHIDSKVLDSASEAGQPLSVDNWDSGFSGKDVTDANWDLTNKQRAMLLRQMADTVGQPGKPGGNIKNVISVGMLSEGWDAKTVTHIMGLRAFTSPLLCEQVVGRGLRRTSYEPKIKPNPVTGVEMEMFDPEHVNVFGVPFSFLPHEEEIGDSKPDVAKIAIHPVEQKLQHRIEWPVVIRIEHVYSPVLKLNLEEVNPLALDALQTPQIAELAPVIDEQPDLKKITTLDLEKMAQDFRMQRVIFETARDVFDEMKPQWVGDPRVLVSQLIRLIEKFIESGKIIVEPSLFYQDELRRRLVITLNMTKVVRHILGNIASQNYETLVPVFEKSQPIRSTSDMPLWHTAKPVQDAARSHINYCVCDSSWESLTAVELGVNPNVLSWVKNDHLGFEIHYVYQGVVRKYRPDFIIRLRNQEMLVLEVKGQEDEKSKAKHFALDKFVQAINSYGGFGCWKWDVLRNPGDLMRLLARACDENLDIS